MKVTSFSVLPEGAHLWRLAREEPHFSSIANNYRFLGDYERAVTDARSKQTEFLVIWGDTGTFKSSAVKLIRDCVYISPGNNGLWWGDYEPNRHRVVILDEFDGKWCRPMRIKELVNHLPLTVDVKGSSRQFRAELLVATSNKSPREWWKENLTDTPAIMRRITAEFQHVRGVFEGVTRIVVNKIRGDWFMHPLHSYLSSEGVQLPDTKFLTTDELEVTQECTDAREERWSQYF